jgi:hypothetical protein
VRFFFKRSRGSSDPGSCRGEEALGARVELLESEQCTRLQQQAGISAVRPSKTPISWNGLGVFSNVT